MGSPFKVVKSPANNNRNSNPNNTGRDGRKTINNSSSNEIRSPSIKQEKLKQENVDAFETERSDRLLQVPKQETSANVSTLQSSDVAPNYNTQYLQSAIKAEKDVGQKSMPIAMPTMKV